jgi:hypothetical protein
MEPEWLANTRLLQTHQTLQVADATDGRRFPFLCGFDKRERAWNRRSNDSRRSSASSNCIPTSRMVSHGMALRRLRETTHFGFPKVTQAVA